MKEFSAMPTADLLSPDSLAWALTHVKRFGDTDLFPVPFEYEAIAHDWNSIGVYLAALNLTECRLSADRRLMVLKPGGGFRAATQLDPLDHLVYTAFVYEAAANIEASRIPADQRVVCSYRIATTPEGAFFPPDNGWKTFHERSKELSNNPSFSQVFVADISDFYNQLGQHRIQNALEAAGVTNERSRNIERFLSLATGKQSQGLPVGPAASILLAEACLIDVDNYLIRHRATYVRYVDDFRIFASNRKEGVETRHSLSKYLFEVHRLTLEGGKSYIHAMSRFTAEELTDPEETEREAVVAKLTELLDELGETAGPYWEGEIDEKTEKAMLTQAEKDALLKLFKECVEQRPLQLGLARYLLRKAARLRTTLLLELVLSNLENLAPAIRDVVSYISIATPKRSEAKTGKRVLKFARQSDVGSLPFVRAWLLELLRKRPNMASPTEALSFANESVPDLGERPAALLAGVHGQMDWVRDRKETWRNCAPWDRRALLWATTVLPRGERHPFLSLVIDQGDLIDSAIAKYLKSLPN